MTEIRNNLILGHLKIGISELFGIWILGFEIYLRPLVRIVWITIIERNVL